MRLRPVMVGCRRCGARPGHSCFGEAGGQREPHRVRVEDADRASELAAAAATADDLQT